METRKNLCAMLPVALHTRVRQEQEKAGMTLGEYVEAMITEYYDWKDGKIMTRIRFAVTLSSARIYYQSESRLSTLFFEFLQIILWLLLVVLIAAESPNIQPRPAPMHSRRSSRSQSAARTSARQAPSFPMAF